MMTMDSQCEVIVVTIIIGAMDSCYDPESIGREYQKNE
jgi:hypothetical protein